MYKLKEFKRNKVSYISIVPADDNYFWDNKIFEVEKTSENEDQAKTIMCELNRAYSQGLEDARKEIREVLGIKEVVKEMIRKIEN